MKSRVAGILLLITTVFSYCKKNSVAIPVIPVKEYFRGKLNGVPFNDTATARIIPAASPGLYIQGFHPNGGINLTIRSFDETPGERPLNETNHIWLGNAGGSFYAGSIVAGTPIQGSGKIHILEITSSYIRGSFECEAPADSSWAVLPTQHITEGEFKLKRL